jgi:hypothetical protein
MSERPTYVVRLRPETGVDGVRALRTLLKIALRRLGLRAIDAQEETSIRDVADDTS